MKGILASKEGSAMVEAAIFYPIITLAAMFVIYTCINMYSMTALQARAHMVVRQAAGSEKGKVSAEASRDYEPDRYMAEAENKKIVISSGGGPLSKSMETMVSDSYEGGRLLGVKRTKARFKSSAYVVDEMTAARLREFLG